MLHKEEDCQLLMQLERLPGLAHKLILVGDFNALVGFDQGMVILKRAQKYSKYI